MALKKRQYNLYKKLCKFALSNVPIATIYGLEPIFPPDILVAMLPDFIKEQNFEACKAIDDSIREWFAERGCEIPADKTLKIPTKSIKPKGIVCLGDPSDPAGMKSAGAIWM